MENSKRNFVNIIREICDEEEIEMNSFSYDWIFQLKKSEKDNYIIGYKFGLNSSSVDKICCDKSAASEIMDSLNIPNVKHYFFMDPIERKYIGEIGCWMRLEELLEKFGEIVCKPNEGTGGNLVFHVCNQYDLEVATHRIFKSSRSMAVAPYYNIINEYRVIVLDSEIKLTYKKQRPCIIGDGKSSIESLLLEYQLQREKEFSSKEILDNLDTSSILTSGERIELNWKHNLGQGADAVIVDNPIIICKVTRFIEEIVNEMNIRFASIDIIECEDGYRVLEINSGVMMEHFSQQNDDTYAISKEIYREAINKMFK